MSALRPWKNLGEFAEQESLQPDLGRALRSTIAFMVPLLLRPPVGCRWRCHSSRSPRRTSRWSTSAAEAERQRWIFGQLLRAATELSALILAVPDAAPASVGDASLVADEKTGEK